MATQTRYVYSVMGPRGGSITTGWSRTKLGAIRECLTLTMEQPYSTGTVELVRGHKALGVVYQVESRPEVVLRRRRGKYLSAPVRSRVFDELDRLILREARRIMEKAIQQVTLPRIAQAKPIRRRR
jgi:hypothetical protein